MIYEKVKPVGIDVGIQKIQGKLFSTLLSSWGMISSDYDCYGRVYRNQDKDGRYIPEPYTGQQGREYGDPLYNDKKKATSFFGISSQRDYIGGKTYRATCHLIFQVDLAKVKPLIAHRADEEVHVDVLNVFSRLPIVTNISSVITDMDNVYREYNGYKAQDGVRFADMHPRHCFRINFDLTYTNNDCVPFFYNFDEAEGLNSILNFEV